MSTVTPLTREQIRDRYEYLQMSFWNAVAKLQALGMTEDEAGDYLELSPTHESEPIDEEARLRLMEAGL